MEAISVTISQNMSMPLKKIFSLMNSLWSCSKIWKDEGLFICTIVPNKDAFSAIPRYLLGALRQEYRRLAQT